MTAAPLNKQAGQAPRSSLYECRVSHERLSPLRHAFAYRLFYLALDLDELPALHGRLRLFSTGRFNLFSLRQADYLPTADELHNPSQPGAPRTPPIASSPAASLKSRVLTYCGTAGHPLPPDTRVLLVTLPRVLGYQFNPVSFYFCSAPDGSPLVALAEVSNTFHEKKPFLIPLKATGAGAGRFQLRTPKFFYVSPFSGLDLDFDFRLASPDRRLAVRIDDYAGSDCVLRSSLTGSQRGLSDARLAWFSIKYPFVTLKTILLIHWQAMLLWFRRVPFHKKSAAPELQRDLYHPHTSIANSTRP